MSKKAFKFRIYPTKQQEQALLSTLNLCRELYNASLEERKEAYRMSRVTITYNQQANQLPEIKELKIKDKETACKAPPKNQKPA